jgi:hypothetical protein
MLYSTVQTGLVVFSLPFPCVCRCLVILVSVCPLSHQCQDKLVVWFVLFPCPLSPCLPSNHESNIYIFARSFVRIARQGDGSPRQQRYSAVLLPNLFMWCLARCMRLLHEQSHLCELCHGGRLSLILESMCARAQGR